MIPKNRAQSAFEKRYQYAGISVKAPGRINLIGEHTDYNNGFVLPAAINRYVYITIGLSGSSGCTLYAVDLDDEFSFDLNNIHRTGTWADYILGGFVGLKSKYLIDRGFNMVISGDIPQGAGLSSSAALECAAILALTSLYQLKVDNLEIARMALECERSFVGLDCGIMDQYASMFGKKEEVMLIDCMNETHRYFPLELGEYRLILINSGITHALADSSYNERRRQCEEGVQSVRREYSHVTSLRQVSMDMLQRVESDLPEVIFRRCAYVIRENDRVLQMTDLLSDSEFAEAGMLLSEAHDDMRSNYEITCEQTDFLVAQACNNDWVLGARQMGGGFGGCTINLIHNDKIEPFKSFIENTYYDAFAIKPELIEVETSDGAVQLYPL